MTVAVEQECAENHEPNLHDEKPGQEKSSSDAG